MSTTITVMMDIPLRPDVADVDAAFHHDLPATRAFAGNLSTEVVAEDSRPDHLLMITRWEDEQSYAAYVAWRRTPGGVTRLADIAAAAPTVRTFRTRLEL